MSRRISRPTPDGRDYPRTQILTIRELLEEADAAAAHPSPYQQAERIASKKAAEQQEMFG